MTAQERVAAAIAARDKATPGPWKAELCLGGSYVIDNTLPENGGKVRHIAEVYGHLSTPSDACLIAAAPDLVDEVIRLREWQQEALPWMNEARIPLLEQIVLWSDRGREEMCRNRLVALDRLIAEAQEE